MMSENWIQHKGVLDMPDKVRRRRYRHERSKLFVSKITNRKDGYKIKSIKRHNRTREDEEWEFGTVVTNEGRVGTTGVIKKVEVATNESHLSQVEI